MDNHEESIWVSKEFAERWKKVTTEVSNREQQEKVFDEYIKTVTDKVRDDFKCNLESLEEDAAMFTGLMLKVKQTFGKAKDEHLDASYELWEKFEAEIPSVNKKIDLLLKTLRPLKDELTEINKLVGQISTYDIDRLINSVDALSNSYGKNAEMVAFLVNNFGKI